MEPLFVNVYVRNDAVMKEYLGKMLLRRPIDIIFYIFAGIYLVESIITWFWLEYFQLHIWLMIAVVVLLKFVGYRRSLKLTLQRDMELNGGEPVQLCTTVSEGGLVCRTNVDAPEVPFSSVKKVVQTKNLIILISKARLAFVLTRDGFTKGTAQELLQFLRGKGIKVKGK